MAIRHKRKTTGSYVWQSSDLVEGQIGVNTVDATLHVRDSEGRIATVGGGIHFWAIASANLAALRVATLDGSGQWIYATTATPGHAEQALAFLRSAATASAQTEALLFGPHEDSGWSWDISKPIWLGADGQLTQIQPTADFYRVVARPLSPTVVLFQPEPGVVFA